MIDENLSIKLNYASYHKYPGFHSLILWVYSGNFNYRNTTFCSDILKLK